ncbi:hypothetical protein J6590_000725 [Homalodisca vitripennis]|nr:hypothetical protein J6590_000725 [Homalodisca vitripennis]
MRVQLNEFIARSSEGVVSDLEESADEPRIPVTDDLMDDPRPAFPQKTRTINPLAPALPKIKPLEIPITFSNFKSFAVIDTGSTRSIVAESVFDALSKFKGVVKKVEETSLTATPANGSDVSFKFLAHIHFKLACFSWTFPFLVANNLPVPVLIRLDFIQASEMSINAAQCQVSFLFDNSLVIAENQEDDHSADATKKGLKVFRG